jgi:hypothetical protein
LFACAAPARQFQRVADCSGPEYHRLDFWLGEWDVASPAGNREGQNRITRAAGGCALHEDWTDADGSSGESLFFYDRAAAAWKQAWATSAGGWKEKSEQPFDGGVRFAGTLPRSTGGALLDRTTLTTLPGGRVRQVIEQSADGGATWQAWEGIYSRRPRPAACTNHDFDFWIGDWDVTVHAKEGEAKGTNRIEATHAGCVIEERFRAEGPGEPWAGHSISAFQDGAWRQAWVDDSGAFLAFRGGMQDGKMVLLGEPRAGVRMRMVFSAIGRDALHWSWERSEDGEKSWTPVMTIDYRRRPT